MAGGVNAFLQLQSEGEEEEEEEEEGEGRSNGDVIVESMPLPRQLPGERQSVLVAMRTKTRQAGVFPELDSALLEVQYTMYMYMYMHVCTLYMETV